MLTNDANVVASDDIQTWKNVTKTRPTARVTRHLKAPAAIGLVSSKTNDYGRSQAEVSATSATSANTARAYLRGARAVEHTFHTIF